MSKETLALIGGANVAVRYIYTNMQKKGEVVSSPKRGDIAFYDWSPTSQWNHIGIVESVSGNTVVVIEGNTSDMVKRMSRNKAAGSYKMGFARPKYGSGQLEKVLSIAAKEIGTKEKYNNEVKYNNWYYGKTVNGSAYPWCAAFVSWCFDQLSSASSSAGNSSSGGSSSGSSSSSTSNSGAGTYKVTTNFSPLNIRSGAGTNYKVVGSYAKGTSITVTEVKGGWAKTNKGWVSTQWITKTGSSSSSSNSSNSSSGTKYKVTTNSKGLNIRQTARSNGKIVGSYNKGDIITVTSISNGWAKTSKGYVSAQWITKV